MTSTKRQTDRMKSCWTCVLCRHTFFSLSSLLIYRLSLRVFYTDTNGLFLAGILFILFFFHLKFFSSPKPNDCMQCGLEVIISNGARMKNRKCEVKSEKNVFKQNVCTKYPPNAWAKKKKKLCFVGISFTFKDDIFTSFVDCFLTVETCTYGRRLRLRMHSVSAFLESNFVILFEWRSCYTQAQTFTALRWNHHLKFVLNNSILILFRISEDFNASNGNIFELKCTFWCNFWRWFLFYSQFHLFILNFCFLLISFVRLAVKLKAKKLVFLTGLVRQPSIVIIEYTFFSLSLLSLHKNAHERFDCWLFGGDVWWQTMKFDKYENWQRNKIHYRSRLSDDVFTLTETTLLSLISFVSATTWKRRNEMELTMTPLFVCRIRS